MIYLARLRGLSRNQATANSRKWMERLQVLQYEKKLLETLSKGNQQKVQLASTLVCDPDIVILDEPFSGLDPVNSQILQDVVKELISEGKIVIFSSHQMSYVEEFCEEIAIINRGDVVLAGNLLEIKKEFGRNQIVISSAGMSQEDMEQFMKSRMADYVEVTGRTREDVIVKLSQRVTRKQLFRKLAEMEELEMEHFETYKPSLNDIFVAKVGEDK